MDGADELEFLEFDMFESEEIGELIARRHMNAGESAGWG